MNIKKGLLFVAFGFLFTLVNINLIINDLSINITPDFIGWLLLFLAFDKLEAYTKDKQYLKWLSLALAIFSGVVWVFGLLKPEVNINVLNMIVNIVGAIYMFMMFGVLENIAHDHAPSKQSTLGLLKYVNVLLYVLFALFAVLASTNENRILILISFGFGAAAIVCAIITAVTLFSLSKEVNN